MMKDILRISTVAKLLEVSPKTVQRYTESGLLRALTRAPGEHRRYAQSEITRFRKANLGGARSGVLRCPHCGKSLVSGNVERKPVAKGGKSIGQKRSKGGTFA